MTDGGRREGRMAGPWRIRFGREEADLGAEGQMWRLLMDPHGEPAGVMTVCPWCGRRGAVLFRGKGAGYWLRGSVVEWDVVEWDWNGDWDRPTLTPSVCNQSERCGMHVWVRDGWMLDAGTPPHGGGKP